MTLFETNYQKVTLIPFNLSHNRRVLCELGAERRMRFKNSAIQSKIKQPQYPTYEEILGHPFQRMEDTKQTIYLVTCTDEEANEFFASHILLKILFK